MTNQPLTKTKTQTANQVVTRETRDGDEQDMLRVPISSTRPDRENDEFDRSALEEMADQIRAENPMVFDNHGLAGSWMDAIPYDSRETIGAQMDAEVETAEDSESDLYALVNPDGTHPEGERMIKQVRDEGQPIKFSVGFKIKDSDEKTDDAGNEIGRIFTSADLMETSRVGIPANPDASVTQSFTAKDGAEGGLPGYANHPFMQMMQAMSGNTPTEAGMVGKQATPDGGKDPIEELRAEVRELRELIKEGDDDDDDDDEEEDDAKEECTVDTDCPEGEVCLEGECVPEDDVDDEESESSDVPEHIRSELEERREREQELEAEIAEIRDALSGGRGESETGDTDMTQNSPEPEETDELDDEDAGSGLLG